jgi:hypothetical protein
MAVEPTYAQGITFVFSGDTYTATSISVSRNCADFDVTSTEIPAGQPRRFRLSDIENCEIKVDWISGGTIPIVDKTAAFTLTGPSLGHIGAIAMCTGLSITASAGELIKGSATFKVSYD